MCATLVISIKWWNEEDIMGKMAYQEMNLFTDFPDIEAAGNAFGGTVLKSLSFLSGNEEAFAPKEKARHRRRMRRRAVRKEKLSARVQHDR